MIKIDITLERDSFPVTIREQWPARGVSALFGPSGCGKSSVLRCLAGLEPDCRGFISVNDEIWQDDNNGIFLKPSQRPAALAFQSGALFPHMSVSANLEFGLRRKGQMRQSLNIDEVIDMLDLHHLLGRNPSDLSGGEAQRVAIGQTLLTHPSVLLLDEPMSGLDFQRKNEILPFLDRLHRELDIPVIYVSHLPGEVMRVADYLMLMQRGSIRASGPIEQVLLDDCLPQGLKDRALTLLPAEVAEYNVGRKTVTVVTRLGTFNIASAELLPGSKAQVCISANAVQIAAADALLKAVVEACSNESDGRILVRYRIGEQHLFGRCTVAMIQDHPVRPGDRVSLAIMENLLEVSATTSPAPH